MAKVKPPSKREIKDAAVAQVLRVLREFRAKQPDADVYAAAYYMFYCDGSWMSWPMVAIGTQENLLRDDGTVDEGLRWSPADWGYDVEAEDTDYALAKRVHDYALTLGGEDAYDDAYERRFLRIFPKAAKAATKQAIAEGLADEDFIVVPLDEAMELVRPALTEEQLRRHFPELVAAELARQSILDLPQPERITTLIGLLDYQPGALVTWEDASAMLRDEGVAAVPQLVAALRGELVDVGVVSLLADINHADPEAISALEAVMLDENQGEPERCWSASALARLGRQDLILAQIEALPDWILASLAAPYCSFADRTRDRNLDYRPLEQILSDHPRLKPVIKERLHSPPCSLRDHEVPEAERATRSEFSLVRKHAKEVLKRYRAR